MKDLFYGSEGHCDATRVALVVLFPEETKKRVKLPRAGTGEAINMTLNMLKCFSS